MCFLENIFNFVDLVMKYHIKTANFECSMNQIIYKTDFVAKRYETIILSTKSNRRFCPMH